MRSSEDFRNWPDCCTFSHYSCIYKIYNVYIVVLKFWQFQCQQVLPVTAGRSAKTGQYKKNNAAILAEIILINVWQLVV